ncbi:hypothetical protein CDO73_09020 [Saccharibacillus sp. O23]|uniref:S-layer homology domain-containing protein n=1 Tax=Saccharibacillus sp. O23 TaxID=2009338 RepID=UPI000B4E414C|nr:S-layer homology domain-containing protein [Saccharibacillus sp. O23]OWR30726.1 hypothetical protein CDO73_09020 [Saccharibacillus sp. O23]
MKKTAAAYAGKRWLRKGFLVTLTVMTVGATFSTVGVGKVGAEPVDRVVQIVAGTGEPGSLKVPEAAWSQLGMPTDIHVIEWNSAPPFGPVDPSRTPHLLLFNDPENGETWLSAGNGISYPGSFQPPSDYMPVNFKTPDNQVVTAKEFAYPRNSSSGAGVGALYFIGSVGSSPPNVFRINNAQPPSGGQSGQAMTFTVEPLLNPNPLTSAAGLAVDEAGNIYTYDDNAGIGYRIIPSQDGRLPYTSEEVPYMNNAFFAEQNSLKDIVIRDGYMYLLDDLTMNPSMVRKIKMEDEGSEIFQIGTTKHPTALAVDPYGEVYIADTGNHRIVQFGSEDSSGVPNLIPVAGTGVEGKGDPGQAAPLTALDSPQGVAVADDGTLYISDTGNHRVLEVAAKQASPTEVTGRASNGTVDLSWTAADQALYYQVYKYAGTSAPLDPKSWQYAGQTDMDEASPPTALTVTGLTNGQPYIFAVRAKGWRSTSEFAVSPALTPVGPPPTNPSNPSTGGGTSTPVTPAPAPTPTNTTTINVNVQNSAAANGSVVASLAITRTTGTDGTLKDALQLTPAKATEIIDLLKQSGSKTAAIVLPDPNDAVSQWDFTVPNAASKLLADQGIELVVLNPNVRIQVPASSLTGLTDDLYFRLIPVKSTATSAEIQQRALANPEIVAQANGGDIKVVGRPMTIETNLQSRPVTLTLPLPATSTFTAAQQQKLGVYIEHSDGTKQLVRGKIVTLDNGRKGLEISVNKFSTFTIVSVSKWGSTLNAAPYIMGYPDGTFKPAQGITRSELAAIVGRITGMTEGMASFSDVKNGSWASTVIGPAAASGIMTGYSDGTFKPNAPITRGELASVLAKLLPQSGLEARPPAAGFRDLNGHWSSEAVAQLQSQDIVTGYADGSFRPEQTVTRAEAVTMINRLIGLDGSMALPDAGQWSDVSMSYWAYDAIRAASMAR